jgi:hypothetical protein
LRRATRRIRNFLQETSGLIDQRRRWRDVGRTKSNQGRDFILGDRGEGCRRTAILYVENCE